jgi:hypothetical protein
MFKSYSQAGQDLFVLAMLQNKRYGTYLEIGAGHPKFGSNSYALERYFGYTGVSIDLVDYLKNSSVSPEINWRSFYNTIRKYKWAKIPNNFDDLPNWVQESWVRKECENHQYSFNNVVPIGTRQVWSEIRPETQFIQTDATKFDYSTLPDYFDYLQVDIDPPDNNLKVLKKITKTQRFGVITFEHDVWDRTRESWHAMTESRRLLDSLGYEMVVNNVTIEPGQGEGLEDDPIFFEDWWVDPAIIPRSIIDRYKWIDYSPQTKYAVDILNMNKPKIQNLLNDQHWSCVPTKSHPLDIDVHQIVIILRLIKGTSFPQWNFSQPFNIMEEKIIDDDTKLVTVVVLATDNDISLQYSGKTTSDTIVDSTGAILKDQSLKIDNLFVNDIKIELLAIKDHSKFVPEYTASRIKYAEEHDIDLPKEMSTYHMFDNGQWTFEFERPFFLWYNDILMNQIYNSGTSIWVKRSHLGLPDDSTVARLDTLLNKI